MYIKYLTGHLVISLVINFLGHSEIGHFGHSVVGEQNISGGQIAVEDLMKKIDYRKDVKFLL